MRTISRYFISSIFCIIIFMVGFIPTQSFAQSGPSKVESDLLFILDASGSMQAQMQGKSMMDWAKAAIKSSLTSVPQSAYVGLRVYGHRIEKTQRDQSCKDSELMVPIDKGNAQKISQLVDQINPKGWTPIAYSLEQTINDFSKYREALNTIILVSDGIETCDGNPIAAAQKLKDAGFKLKIFTVGFNVDAAAKKQLQDLANKFNGTYSDAKDGASLQVQLNKLTQESFVIKKAKTENRVRGGDSYETAVLLKPNVVYQLDHHQKKNDFDYFKIDLQTAEAVSIQVKPTPYCISIQGTQSTPQQNNECEPEAYRFQLLNDIKQEIVTAAQKNIITDYQTDFANVAQNADQTTYFVVGSVTNDMHRDHEFMVITKTFGDLGGDIDAGKNFSEALPIKAGLYEKNHLSAVDTMDIYKLALQSKQGLKVALTLTKSDLHSSEIRIEVVDELGAILAKADSIEVGQSATLTVPPVESSGDYYIRITADHYPDNMNYSLGLKVVSP